MTKTTIVIYRSPWDVFVKNYGETTMSLSLPNREYFTRAELAQRINELLRTNEPSVGRLPFVVFEERKIVYRGIVSAKEITFFADDPFQRRN